MEFYSISETTIILLLGIVQHKNNKEYQISFFDNSFF